VNWRKEIVLFFLISFMIWFVLFLLIYGAFLVVEVFAYNGAIALQILSMKWFFSLYFSILFSLETWALGLHDLMAMYFERKNIIKHLHIVVDGMAYVTQGSPSDSFPSPRVHKTSR
jgi:hypothetical protein